MARVPGQEQVRDGDIHKAPSLPVSSDRPLPSKLAGLALSKVVCCTDWTNLEHSIFNGHCGRPINRRLSLPYNGATRTLVGHTSVSGREAIHTPRTHRLSRPSVASCMAKRNSSRFIGQDQIAIDDSGRKPDLALSRTSQLIWGDTDFMQKSNPSRMRRLPAATSAETPHDSSGRLK